MMDATKYQIGYYPAPAEDYEWTKKDHITTPPAWCSVDLRDGNQSLVIPMSLEEKLEFLDAEMVKYARDYGKLNHITKQKEETAEALEAKMDRWMYLEELAAKIARQ